MLGDAHHLYAAVNPSGAFAGPLAHVQAYKDALLVCACVDGWVGLTDTQCEQPLFNHRHAHPLHNLVL